MDSSPAMLVWLVELLLWVSVSRGPRLQQQQQEAQHQERQQASSSLAIDIYD